MSEMSLIADHYVIIGRGRLIADMTAAELQDLASESSVRVRTPQAGRLREVLAAEGAVVSGDGLQSLEVAGTTAEAIGDCAARVGIPLHELTPHRATLEEIFMELTRDAVEYATGEAPEVAR